MMGSSPDSPKKGEAVAMVYPNQSESQSQQLYPPPTKGADSTPPPPPSTSYQQYPNPYAPYPPYPSPYQPYPPPYGQPPPPYNDYYYQQYCRQESESSANFARVLLILMLLLLSSILLMSFIMWFLFAASVPEFSIAALSVANFSASAAAAAFSGTWTVQFQISNVNTELDVRFDRGVATVVYKDSMLAVAAMEPFDVRKSQRMPVDLTVPSLQDQSWISPTLAADRSSGVVVVSLRMALDANFTAPDVIYRQQRLRVLCEDLPISFAAPTSGDGAMAHSVGNHCFVRLRD